MKEVTESLSSFKRKKEQEEQRTHVGPKSG
jgi:hypothetical protein